MKCNQCGRILDDNSLFCNQCGAPVESIEDDRNQPIQMEESVEVNMTPNRNKNRKGIIIGVGAGILLIAIVLVLCFSPLKYWIIRTFTDPADLLVDAYTGSIHDLFKLSHYAEEITGTAKQEAQGTKTEMHIKLSDNALSSLSESMFGYSVNMSWLSDIALNVQTSAKENLMKTDLELGLAKHSLLTAEAILDSQSKNLWLTVPELQNQWLKTNLTDADIDALAPSMISGIQLPDEVAEKILVRYTELFLKGFTKVEKSKQNITAGSMKQNVTVLKASMSEEEYFTVLSCVFNQMKEDQELKQILTDAGVYENFIASVDVYLEDFPELIEESDPEKLVYLHTYLNQKNGVTGFEYTMTDEIEKIRAIILADKKQFAVDFTVGTFKLEGSGSVGTQTESVWQIKESGNLVMDLQVKAVVDKSSGISCNAHLKPSSELVEEMFGTASGAEVEIAFNGNAQQGDVDIAVKNNGQALFSIDCATSLADAHQIVIPENAVDMNDEAAMNNWAMGIDPTQLITALTDAGFPIEMLLASMIGG